MYICCALVGAIKDSKSNFSQFRKVSVDGHLYIGAPVLGNLEEGLSIRDFESRLGSGDGHLFL